MSKMRFAYSMLGFWSCFSATMPIVADEFPVRLPSSFRTEVFVEEKYIEGFRPVQFMTTEVQFNDFRNYRYSRMAINTIDGIEEDGRNLQCGQSERIVIDGQVLTLDRTSELYKGEVPTRGDFLIAAVEEKCRHTEWSVFYSATDDLQNSLGRTPGLTAIIGSLDFLNHDRTAFSIEKPTRTNSETVDANILGKNVSSRLTLQKWEAGWRVTQLNSIYANPPRIVKNSIRENASGFEMETHWTKTADDPESHSTARLTNMQFEIAQNIALRNSIKNRSVVSIKGSPQIRAVWMDGKVVRVYDGGMVDDLGSATFRTSSGASGFARVMWLTVFLVATGGIVLWLRRNSK